MPLALRRLGNTCLVGIDLVKLKISSLPVLDLTKIFFGSCINQNTYSKPFGTVFLFVCNSLYSRKQLGKCRARIRTDYK